jgi:hypothetical protein
MAGYPAGGAAPPRGCGARSFLDRGASAGHPAPPRMARAAPVPGLGSKPKR